MVKWTEWEDLLGSTRYEVSVSFRTYDSLGKLASFDKAFLLVSTSAGTFARFSEGAALAFFTDSNSLTLRTSPPLPCHLWFGL